MNARRVIEDSLNLFLDGFRFRLFPEVRVLLPELVRRNVLISLASYNVGREVMYWLLGGLEGRTWDHLLLGGPAILVGTAGIAASAKEAAAPPSF